MWMWRCGPKALGTVFKANNGQPESNSQVLLNAVTGQAVTEQFSIRGMIALDWSAPTEFLLIITGTMGSGKTTVLGEASDILALRNVPHAAIDLDALGLAHLPSAMKNDGVMYRNFRSLCENYAFEGVTRLLLARAIEDRNELEVCTGISSAASTVVCRLTASPETIRQRLQRRELGVKHSEYIDRSVALNAILDTTQLADFAVSTENRSPTDVANEMLSKAGWI